MKSSAKRLLAVLIVLAMALSLVPVMAFAAGTTTTVYCQAPSGWSTCKAYWWGSKTGTNPSWPGVNMTKGEDGIWTYDVPSDATGLIFNNGNGTQTADLKVPTDEKTMYVFQNRVWAVPVLVEIEEAYYVAGGAALCGVEWDPGAAANKMDDSDKDGIYTLTYTGVAAGTYEFKVTNGTWDQSWGQPGSTANYKLTVTEADTTVEIRFDSKACLIDVVLNNITVPTTTPAPIVEGYYIAGNFNGWTNPDGNYLMADNGDGTYSLSFEVAAGTVELKVTNGTWDDGCNWGDNGGNVVKTAAVAGTITVSFNPATGAVTVTGECLDETEEPEKEPLVINTVHLVGAEGLTGADWDPAANEMRDENGIYVIIFENVAAGTYEFKFAANGTWDINWATGEAMESGEAYTVWFNAMGNSSVVIPADGATVTLMLDLKTMDKLTGEGAMAALTIEGVEIPEPGPDPEPEPVPAGTYYVAGDFNGWNQKDEAYVMTEVDGIYTITFAVAAGNHELKVTDGTWDNSWGKDGGNYAFSVEADGEITVIFDGENVNVIGGFIPAPDPLVINSIHVAGAADLTGVEWDPTANEMTNVNGVYFINFENVAAGTYEFKFVANGSWDLNWASGIAIASGETQTAWKNALGNSSIVVEQDGSNVFLAFDINSMDPYTGEGATMKAMVTVPVIELGATVSGAVVSGAEGDVTIELIAEGEVVASVTAAGKEGTYSIVDVAAGTYTLKVSQTNHVEREYTITVGDEDVAQDVKIQLIGDIDGNGKINMGDVSKLNAHLKGTNKLTDEYQIACANVNGGVLNMGDNAALYSHIKGTKKLY